MTATSGPGTESGPDTPDELPDGVDEAAVARMRTVARLLDDSVRVPGTTRRIGLDPIIGVLPVAGDALTTGLSLYIVLESARLGVPTRTLVRMVANVAVDAAGGSVPVVGDLFDATFKANQRNVDLALAALAAEPGPRGTDGTRRG